MDQQHDLLNAKLYFVLAGALLSCCQAATAFIWQLLQLTNQNHRHGMTAIEDNVDNVSSVSAHRI